VGFHNRGEETISKYLNHEKIYIKIAKIAIIPPIPKSFLFKEAIEVILLNNIPMRKSKNKFLICKSNMVKARSGCGETSALTPIHSVNKEAKNKTGLKLLRIIRALPCADSHMNDRNANITIAQSHGAMDKPDNFITPTP